MRDMQAGAPVLARLGLTGQTPLLASIYVVPLSAWPDAGQTPLRDDAHLATIMRLLERKNGESL